MLERGSGSDGYMVAVIVVAVSSGLGLVRLL